MGAATCTCVSDGDNGGKWVHTGYKTQWGNKGGSGRSNQTTHRTELENKGRKGNMKIESLGSPGPRAWFRPQYKREPQSPARHPTAIHLLSEAKHAIWVVPPLRALRFATSYPHILQDWKRTGRSAHRTSKGNGQHIPLSSTLRYVTLSAGGPTNLCNSS